MSETYEVNSRCNNCASENEINIPVGKKLDKDTLPKLECANCKCKGVFTVFYRYS